MSTEHFERKYHWDLLLKWGLGLSIVIVGIHVIWYKTGWDFFAMAGLFKWMFGVLLFPLLGFVGMLYQLMQRRGSTTFLEVLAHCLLVSILIALSVSLYWITIDTVIRPGYDVEIYEAYAAGMREEASSMENMETKSRMLQQANEYDKSAKVLEQSDYYTMVMQQLAMQLVLGLLFGSVLGFIFSKIRVLPRHLRDTQKLDEDEDEFDESDEIEPSTDKG